MTEIIKCVVIFSDVFRTHKDNNTHTNSYQFSIARFCSDFYRNIFSVSLNAELVSDVESFARAIRSGSLQSLRETSPELSFLFYFVALP